MKIVDVAGVPAVLGPVAGGVTTGA